MKKLISVLENICAALLLALTFCVFFQILARTVFKIPATWTAEMARAFFHIIVFIGMLKDRRTWRRLSNPRYFPVHPAQ